MQLGDRILIELHRAAELAGRPGIAVPSVDLEETARRTGRQSATQAVSRLVRAGRVLPVRRDLLVLPDATGRVTVGVADLVKAIAPDPHLITGGRALEEYGLTNQHFFKVVVLVPARLSPFSLKRESAAFLLTEPSRIWGWQDGGPRYAVPERAILDAVSHPRYGVSLTMALGAIEHAADGDPDFLGRLASATGRYESAATARRLGLLVERLFGPNAADPFRDMVGDSRTPVLLRSTGRRRGPIDRKWRVVVNASITSAVSNP